MPSYLMVRCDVEVRVWLDGSEIGTAAAGEYKRFEIIPGAHALKIESADGKYAWSDKIHAPAGEQILVEPTLIPTDPKIGIAASFKNTDGQKYRTTKVNGMEWMAENLRKGDHQDRGGLYTLEEAIRLTPKGWRLPSENDFKRLIDFYKPDSFEELTTGRSGFTAQFYGILETGHRMGDNETASYWLSSGGPRSKSQATCNFRRDYKEVSIAWGYPQISERSVRYCRELLVLQPAP